MMRDTEYYKTYEPILKSTLKCTDTYIASLREDEDVIVAYLNINHDNDILNYIYVKDAWRGIGVAKLLMQAAEPKNPCYFTHWTDQTQSLINKHKEFIYNPFLLGVFNGNHS